MIVRLENSKDHREQVVNWRDANKHVHEYGKLINSYTEESEEHWEKFIKKHRDRVFEYLNTLDFCRPVPPNTRIERLDYHTNKKY